MTHDLWQALGEQIGVFLASVSLEDVCQRRIQTQQTPLAAE